MFFVPEVVDFGLISASNKTVSKQFKLKNVGALDGNFSINYHGDHAITFSPARDILPANGEILIKVFVLFQRSVYL
jgi:hypothetical protein